MNKLYLSSALLAIFALPALANIDKNASTATCDSATIGATSGDAYMDTAWTANTINLDWYSDGEKISTGSCTYDGAIELPNDPEDKTGYTFGGWKVRVASNNNNNQTPITLSSLYSSETINVFSSKSLNPGVYCIGSSGWDPDAEDGEGDYIWYGTYEGGSCSDSVFSGLNNGEWTVTMPNGNIVKGEARCSTVSGSWAQTGNPTDDLDLNNFSNGAQYCWCKATSGNTGSGFQPVSSSSWVFVGSIGGDAGGCANGCANNCAGSVSEDDDDFRPAVFGVTE